MKKRIIIIISISFLTIILIGALISYFLFLHHYKGTVLDNPWNKNDEFQIEKIKQINKDKDKDFVILNLADVQMCDLEDLSNRRIIKKELDELVYNIKPSLITLTGDQTWSNENLICLKSLISWLDSYKIPYAPIFGNHDYGNEGDNAVAGKNYCCTLYEKGKYSLFFRGPSNLDSLGNYVINVMEDGKIYTTLYFIDAGYNDIITNQQIEWLKWNAEGLKKYNNNQYPTAMCFMHKPIPEYSIAYKEYLNGNDIDSLGKVIPYYSLSGTMQNGFFTVAKEINIKNIVCGHQHGNAFSLKYEDVWLTFSLKTGELGGYIYKDDYYINGATYFTLNNNEIKIDNYFVDRNKYHFKDPE